MAMQIAGRLLVGGMLANDVASSQPRSRCRSLTNVCPAGVCDYPAPGVPPVTCVRIIQSDVIDFSRYSRWSGCSSIETACGLWSR